MVIDIDFKTLLDSIHNEEKKRQLREQRQKRIEWEYGFYNSFCRLFGYDKKQYESLSAFNRYCLQANIKLV